MWSPRVRFLLQCVMVAATLGLSCAGTVGRPCFATGPGPRDRMLDDDRGADDLDSVDVSNLLWQAREANRRGRYDEAARHARAVARRRGVGPEVLCPAWMNVFYAAHRTGDQAAAAAVLRSFDQSAARLPANDPVVTEMSELKEALGLGVPASHRPPRHLPRPKGTASGSPPTRPHSASTLGRYAITSRSPRHQVPMPFWSPTEERSSPSGTLRVIVRRRPPCRASSRSRACWPACSSPTGSLRWTTQSLGSCRVGPKAFAGESRCATF